MKTFLNKMISTGFFVGYIPVAPGTFGSMFGLILAYGLIKLISYLNPSLSFISSFIFFLIIWTLFSVPSFLSVRYLENNKIFIHDDKKIVIDEIIAQGYVLVFSLMINQNMSELYSTVSSFIWFRIFDISKPSIIGRIDNKMKNYIGTMLDDLIAAIFAIIFIYMTHIFYKG